MKFIKFLSIVIFSLLLTSCSFVKYKEKQVPNTIQTDENGNEYSIDDIKEEYIYKLNDLSSNENYYNEERKKYIDYYIEARSEIIESTTISEIETIFKKYSNLILSLKTKEEYIEEQKYNYFLKHKKDSIELIRKYVDLSLYREKEIESITTILNEYINKITESDDNETIDNLVIEYKIKVYDFKTDVELYKEELVVLIDNSKKEMSNYKDESIYRDNEKLLLQNYISSFNNQIITCETKESVGILVSTYKSMLDSIKTDKMLYEEERIDLVKKSYEELLSLVNYDNLSEKEANEYTTYCDSVKEEMLLLSTKELINSRLINEKKNCYSLGAQLGDEQCLNEYKRLSCDNLYYYLEIDLYRIEQQEEIANIINNQSTIIKMQKNYGDTLIAIDNTHALLDAILTDDEMWKKEDKEFFDSLYQSYGADILTQPSSMTIANDYYELANIIDYYTFYQLDGSTFVRNKFRVMANFEYSNSNQVKVNVYWKCKLIHANAGINITSKNEYLIIELIPYNTASIKNNEILSEKNIQNSYYKEILTNIEKRNNYDLPSWSYEKINGIWNTNQLWYCLEKHHYPICEPGSAAEQSLNKMIEILCTINTNESSDEQKLFNIYQWIGQNVQFNNYFYSDIGYENTVDLDNYPDELLSLYRDISLEGALFDNYAVCYGYAKLLTAMLNLEGIDARFIIARSKQLDGKQTIDHFSNGRIHCVCLVKLNDKWFESDPSRANSSNTNNYFYPYYSKIICSTTDLFGSRTTENEKDIISNICNDFDTYYLFYNNIYNCINQELLLYDSTSITTLDVSNWISIISFTDLKSYLSQYNYYSYYSYCGNKLLYTYIIFETVS